MCTASLSTQPRPGGAEFYLADGLGSTLELSDTTGAIATEYSYEPFGTTTVTGTPTTNSFDFTGREDDGTGLKYYRARYYHPVLQRFISEDPLAFAGPDMNQYRYSRNSPMNWIDPLGLVDSLSTGTVTFLGYSKRLGSFAVISSPFAGFRYEYGHMDPRTLPRVGTFVSAGEYIGEYADPTNGDSTGPHVHVQLRGPLDVSSPLLRGNNLIDPGTRSPIPGGCRTSAYGAERPGRGPHQGVDYVTREDCERKPRPRGGPEDGASILAGRKDVE